jgi:hypothetical protein
MVVIDLEVCSDLASAATHVRSAIAGIVHANWFDSDRQPFPPQRVET